MSDSPLTYTVPQLAALMGTSRSFVYSCMDDGSIPSIKLRGRRLIPAKGLEEALAAMTLNV